MRPQSTGCVVSHTHKLAHDHTRFHTNASVLEPHPIPLHVAPSVSPWCATKTIKRGDTQMHVPDNQPLARAQRWKLTHKDPEHVPALLYSRCCTIHHSAGNIPHRVPCKLTESDLRTHIQISCTHVEGGHGGDGSGDACQHGGAGHEGEQEVLQGGSDSRFSDQGVRERGAR